QIYNNTLDYNLYPVLFAGTETAFDQWMEGCFRVPFNQIPSPETFYPRAAQYRMYINCCASGENGIPPNALLSIILPFYSPLVPGRIVAQPNPSKGEPIAQFIDWWQGGGINLFAAPKTDGK